MKRLFFFLFLIIVISFVSIRFNLLDLTSNKNNVRAQTQNFDWPQVQNNPQHTGYSLETLGTNFKVSWTHPFQPDKVYPQVQAIVYQGKVFVGTEGANGQVPSLYAFNATTGQQAWRFVAGGSILSSVATMTINGTGMVFFASLDGNVYALNVLDGTLRWKTNNLLGRYGFSVSPIFFDNKILLGGQNGVFYALNPNDGSVVWQYQTGSPIYQTAAANNGKVFFGTVDMNVYALNTSNGTLSWKTPIQGMVLKDYWPMVYRGFVFIRSMNMDKNFYALNESDGKEGITNLPQDTGKTMNGATAPPSIDRDGWISVRIGSGGGSVCWGRLNLDNITTGPVNIGGCRNGDETEFTSTSQNLILGFHHAEETSPFAGSNGYFNLDTNTWVNVPFGEVNRQMATAGAAGGGNPASIANGMVYHVVYHELVARTTQ